MKKLLFVLMFAVAGFTTAFSQNEFKAGDKVINLGVGLGNTLHSGSGLSTTIPPISASFEYGVKDNLFDEKSSLGVGAFIGYCANEHKWSYMNASSKLKYSDLVLGLRGALHYQLVEKLDTYAGVSLGYDIVSASSSGYAGGGSYGVSYSADASTFFVGAYLGGRYYFADNLAAMAEVGYDIAALRIGIAYKF